MSEKETTGKLKETGCELSVEWEITNFFSLSEEVNTCYRSPLFYFSDSTWYLEIFPNGSASGNSEGYIGIYLSKGDVGPPIDVTSTFFLQTADGTKETVGPESKDRFDATTKSWGDEILLRSRLIEQKLQLVPFGVLTVVCSLKHCDRHIVGDSPLRRLLNLSQSMRNVLTKRRRTDVALNVQGVEFQAHKMILESRSSVFSAMFTHNMREEMDGVVNIEDIKSDGFEPALSYIYSGTVDDISDKNVFQVYEAAHKYDLKDLEQHCRVFIKNSLSKENVADIVKFSDTYNDKELNSDARKYFNENIKTIIKQDSWRTFCKENQELGMDLLTDVIAVRVTD